MGELIKGRAFFNDEIYEHIFVQGNKLTNKEISKMLDMTEPNITQTWGRFIKSLQKDS